MPPGAFMGFMALYTLLVLAILLSGIGLRRILARSFIALPFALAAVTLLFTVPGDALTTIPIFGGLTITVEGTIRFTTILIKSWISVQAAIFLVTVTPFSDVLWSLRAFRLPQTLVAIVGFTYRYLFLLFEEAQRLMRARAARSASFQGHRGRGSLLWHGKIAGQMVGSLMLRSFERSERVHNAMLARGYQGQIQTLNNPQMRNRDFMVLALVIVFCLATLLITNYFTRVGS